MHVSGVFAPIPTPFTAVGPLDIDAWRANLDRWVTTGLHGLVVLGSNGEAPLIDDDESEQLIAVARERIPSSRLLIAGTGRQSTKCAIDAARRAADVGADAVLVRTPSYFKGQLTTASFIRHFSDVADACPVPVLLYNFTGLTGVTLPVEAVSTLSRHQNVVGIKESGPDLSYVGDLTGLAHDDFSVLVGSAPTFFSSLMLGANGGIMALACVAPAACLRIYELVRDGRLDDARALQRQVVPLAKLVTSIHGIPGLKAALTHLGYVGGAARPPLEPIADEAVEQISRALDALVEATSGVPVGV
jgi:4-hydroxy-2-oxoglutarate aldolase